MAYSDNLHLSFEFFPPKSADSEKELLETAKAFAEYQPDLFTVTYGAGGSTKSRTLETVLHIQTATDITTAAHLSGIGASREEMTTLLSQYQHLGIRHLVALRGDTPSGMHSDGDFHYASDLVKFVREHSHAFDITVAAYPEMHPQSTNPEKDLAHFKHKVDMGATQAFTQYFYNPDAYFYFVDSCHQAGIEIPIIPGIMPITNYRQLTRFSDMCGAEIPRWIKNKLAHYDAIEDKASLQAFGLEAVSLLCDTLLENGAPGIHFYTMNKLEASQSILKNLGF